MTGTKYPVHPDVTVHSGTTIYRTEEWWKAATIRSFGNSDPEIAIYLWHRDEDWSCKNKYHVKTSEAWQIDKEQIEQYLDGEGETVSDQSAFPVSDYYHIDRGESVFKTDGWWKAIVSIDQKGSYETQEIIIYLWELKDGDWRRRQKYAIKNRDDWSEDWAAVEGLLDGDIETSPTPSEEPSSHETKDIVDSEPPPTEADDGILADIQSEVKDIHLGTGVREDM